MDQQKKELMKLMIEKVDACNDIEKLKLILKVLESNTLESFKTYKYKGKIIVIDENIKFNELSDDFDVGEEKGKIVDFIDSVIEENKKLKELKEEHTRMKECLYHQGYIDEKEIPFDIVYYITCKEENERLFDENKKLKAELDDIKFCDKCGMSDNNPNSYHHCECNSDSEEEVEEPRIICVDCCNMGCENKSEEKYIVVRDNGFVEHNCKECYKRDYEEKFTCVNCEGVNFNEEDGPELDVEKFGGWVCEHCYDYLVDGVEE